MPKGKTKKPAKPAVTWREFDEAREFMAGRLAYIEGMISDGLTARDHRIDALDEAICPRVAARLEALEKKTLDASTRVDLNARITRIEQELSALRIWGKNVTEALVEQNKAIKAYAPGKFYAEPQGEATGPAPAPTPRPITLAQKYAVANHVAGKAGLKWTSMSPEDRMVHAEVAGEVIALVEKVRETV